MAAIPAAAEVRSARPLTTADIPHLLSEMLEMIQSDTLRPVSERVKRQSVKIETAAMTPPRVEFAESSEWLRLGLTAREAELASLLRKSIGQCVHRDVLMVAMYGMDDAAPDPKLLDVMVCKMNRKLGQEYRIENERSFGYRLVSLKRKPRDRVQWQGYFVGKKSAEVARYLFLRKGQWVHTRDLVTYCGISYKAAGSIIRRLRAALEGSQYIIESVRAGGYRMELRPT